MKIKRFSNVIIVCLLILGAAFTACENGETGNNNTNNDNANSSANRGFYITGWSSGELASVYILDFDPSTRLEIWGNFLVIGTLFYYGGMVHFSGSDSVLIYQLNGFYTVVIWDHGANSWKATNVQITGGNGSVDFSSFVTLPAR